MQLCKLWTLSISGIDLNTITLRSMILNLNKNNRLAFASNSAKPNHYHSLTSCSLYPTIKKKSKSIISLTFTLNESKLDNQYPIAAMLDNDKAVTHTYFKNKKGTYQIIQAIARCHSNPNKLSTHTTK